MEKAGGEVLSGQLKKDIVYVPKLKPGTMGVEEFKKLTDKIPPNWIILNLIIFDVRDPEQIQMGIIKDAKNIPVNGLKDRLNEILKGKEKLFIVLQE